VVGPTGGSANESSGTFTLQGAGFEIWYGDDQFRYAFQQATGDCSIVAHVNSLQYVPGYPHAKAGIMIRESLSSSSAHVFVGLNSGDDALYVKRSSNGDAWDEGYWMGSNTSAPYWVKLARVGATIYVYIANNSSSTPPTAAQWVQVISTPNNMASTVYIGLVANSNNNTALNQAIFNNVTTTGTTAPYPPATSNNGWTSLDVGTTGALGSTTLANGIFTVKGSGKGLWDNTDAFQYAYWPLAGNGSGNGSMTVKIIAQDNTASVNGPGAAGIALRDNLTSNANSIFIARDAWGNLKFQVHTIDQGYSNTTSISLPTLPCWLKLDRNNGTVTGSYSTNGTTWTTLGTPSTLSMPTEVFIGLTAFSAVPGTLATTTFENVASTGTNPLQPGWFSQDLGTPGLAGSAKDTGYFTVKGSGLGFAGNTDSGQFVYRAVTGNNQIVARVGSQSGATSTTAPAAVMIRDSLTTASKNAVLALSADGTLRFQAHLNANDGTSTTTTTAGVTIPSWLKLLRNNNVITGYYSSDGFNWIQAGSATITLNTNAYLGLAASSKSNSQLATVIYDNVSVGPISIPPTTFPIMTDILSMPGVTLVDEINTATTAPNYQVNAGANTVATIYGKQARTMPTHDAQGNPLPQADTAATMGYIIGANKGLVPGNAYILAVEYPDDVPRAMYITNRGADYIRGLATGPAVGDARAQFTEASVESLSYPQTGQWKVYKEYFHLLDRFQGVVGLREPAPGYRPFTPAQGFYVAITRMKHLNDPRSEGAAIGYIRLYAVADPTALYAPINYPPANLPRRNIFWREEMADGLLSSTGNANDFAVSDSVNWYVYKMKMAKVLGINTFTKDLLEFGFNQGWESGDENWVMNGQAPNNNLWTRLVPKATAEGFDLMPYFEYKGGIGLFNQGLGNERRAHKLYHDVKITCGNSEFYDCAWWTQGQNADLTDPATLVDAKRTLDRTVGDFKAKAKFSGIWFRMRSNCLPMSFAPATIARYVAANPSDSGTTPASLITSYEGNKQLYNRYVDWWFVQRVNFLTSLQQYLRTTLAIPNAQVLFTPWTSEAVPPLHKLGETYGQAGVVTDDMTWWTTFFNNLPVSWWKYQWQPTPYSQITTDHLYRNVLGEQLPINSSLNPNSEEQFHGSPIADPQHYTSLDGIMMTYPIGRLFTLDDVTTGGAPLLTSFKCASGLTVVRHYTLNEDNGEVDPMPLDGQLGYLSVACDRAGNHLMLQQARAIANGDPRNLGYLEASSLSTGFPEIMRRFNQAFLAVPALPSTVVSGGANNTNVVVRRITTTGQGTYFYVVNTSMSPVTGVTVTLSGTGTVKNLVTNTAESGTTLNLNLDPAELRAYRVGP
jgi:regulation of enolase protein 1 (concanavalin A-like superfamily)